MAPCPAPTSTASTASAPRSTVASRACSPSSTEHRHHEAAHGYRKRSFVRRLGEITVPQDRSVTLAVSAPTSRCRGARGAEPLRKHPERARRVRTMSTPAVLIPALAHQLQSTCQHHKQYPRRNQTRSHNATTVGGPGALPPAGAWGLGPQKTPGTSKASALHEHTRR